MIARGHVASVDRTLVAVATVATVCAIATSAHAQTVRVVNMIPATLANETNQDSEPDLTVDPNNRLSIVATAFTPNPSGATATAPVFVSTDGGATWVLSNIVPSANGMTGDITVSCSRNNVLYAGILRGGGGLDMRILRGSPCTGNAILTQLLGRANEDQPYARTITPTTGAQANNDLLYVGHNDLGNTPRSASLEQSLNAATAPPPAGLALIRIERRNPSGQDGPPIRPAMHPNGTVYAVYTQRTASAGNVRTGNIVVVRDDDFGQGANPYSDLLDPGDNLAGRRVVTGVQWIFNNASVFGQERLGDRATIAVDPRNSQTVYVGWVDNAGVAGNTATVHIRRSTDGGANWSADLLTVNGALSPQLAVNSQGQVGCLYQQLTGAGAAQRWQTHFRQSGDGGANWNDTLLATHPANVPAMAFLPYLGDYVGLHAVGEDFYGVFSASNVPDMNNFPSGVTYQRNANFTTNTLLDAANNPVAASIDPFFFTVLAPKPQIQVPGGVAFGESCSGATGTGVLNVCNTGKADLTVTGITSSDPQFSIATPSAGFPVIISPDFCFPFQLAFSSTTPGAKNATLTIASNDPGVPSVQVAATATVGQSRIVTLVADTGSFGEVCAGAANFRDLTVTVNNSGTCALTISSIASSSPEFELAQTLSFPFSVGPGDSIEVPIRFHPASAGAKSANMTFATNDPTAPSKVVALSGTAPPSYACEAADVRVHRRGHRSDVGHWTDRQLHVQRERTGAGAVRARTTPSAFKRRARHVIFRAAGGQLDAGAALPARHAAVRPQLAASRRRPAAGSLVGALSTRPWRGLPPANACGSGSSDERAASESDVVTLPKRSAAVRPIGQPVIAIECSPHVDQLGGDGAVRSRRRHLARWPSRVAHRHAPGAVRHRRRRGAPGACYSQRSVHGTVDVNESFLVAKTIGAVTFGVTLGQWSRPVDYSITVDPLGT